LGPTHHQFSLTHSGLTHLASSSRFEFPQPIHTGSGYFCLVNEYFCQFWFGFGIFQPAQVKFKVILFGSNQFLFIYAISSCFDSEWSCFLSLLA
jgi:hypothetical protein